MNHIIKILFFLLLTGQAVLAQNAAQKADSVFSELYKKGKFNGNVLLAENGKVILSKSYGIANEATGEPLIENSVFELASVSKQFTAMAVMMLKEKGKLALDDSIGKYIPELKFYGNVTIRNLLNHTGGLPDYMESVYTAAVASKKIAVNKDIVATLAKNKMPAVFKPGEKYEYSNTGYALLSYIIEKVSGTSYKNYLEKNIFKPLGMEHSLVYTRRFAPQKIANYAYGYIYSDSLKKWILPDEDKDMDLVIWLDGITGDGSVNSTTTDLLKWDRALYTNKLISKESMQEMFTPPVLQNNQATQYGMGGLQTARKIVAGL